MKERFDFGDVGLKTGDEIQFKEKMDIEFYVASGRGVPGNGGTIVAYKNKDVIDAIDRTSLYSIKALTRRLLDGNLTEEMDVMSLWTYKGKTIRSIYENMNKSEKYQGEG